MAETLGAADPADAGDIGNGVSAGEEFAIIEPPVQTTFFTTTTASAILPGQYTTGDYRVARWQIDRTDLAAIGATQLHSFRIGVQDTAATWDALELPWVTGITVDVDQQMLAATFDRLDPRDDTVFSIDDARTGRSEPNVGWRIIAAPGTTQVALPELPAGFPLRKI